MGSVSVQCFVLKSKATLYGAALVLFLLTLPGCVLTSASEVKISPGLYKIEAWGNTFTSRQRLEKKLLRRAKKVCGHSQFILQGQSNFEVTNTKVYLDGRMTNSRGVKLYQTIDCNAK